MKKINVEITWKVVMLLTMITTLWLKRNSEENLLVTRGWGGEGRYMG